MKKHHLILGYVNPAIKDNFVYYLIIAIIFILLKLGYKIANTNQLLFILKPINKQVEFLTGFHSIYIPEKGYYYSNLNVIIDKSCSGFNFWLLSFVLFAYLGLKYYSKTIYKISVISFSLTWGYLLTIFVNTARIFTSIVIQKQSLNILPNHQELLHESIGIITNLSFLVLAYYFIEKQFKTKFHNEKLS